jgi:hypothetical protein
MPYKGALEEWYVHNQSAVVYFKSIIVTVLVVMKSRSQIAWTVFKGLPEPPEELKIHVNWPS